MKKLLSFILLLSPLTMYPQVSRDLLISEIRGGNVMRQVGRERVEMTPSLHVMSQDILIISDGTIMILLEPKECKRYTVKGPYTGTMHNYIQHNEESCVKTVTAKYMNYLISQTLRTHKKGNGRNEDDHATVFREGDGILDSITVSVKSIDSLYHTIDSLSVVKPDSVVVVPVDSIP